jgi:hypothetical protein
MMIESASYVNWEKLQRILGEDSILIGYRNADEHPSGMNMAELAELLAYDHFTPQGSFVPARPFLEEGLQANEALLQEEVRKYFVKLFNTGERDFDSVGTEAMEGVKEYLNSGELRGVAPNAESTIRRKGHDLPNIDNGDLRDGLVYIAIRGSRARIDAPSNTETKMIGD